MDFPGRYPRVVCDRPGVSHHLDFEARLTDKAVPAQSLGLKVLVPGSKKGYRLLADQLLEEPSRLLAARVERIADQALLLQIRRVHPYAGRHFGAVSENERVRVPDLHLAGDPQDLLIASSQLASYPFPHDLRLALVARGLLVIRRRDVPAEPKGRNREKDGNWSHEVAPNRGVHKTIWPVPAFQPQASNGGVQ